MRIPGLVRDRPLAQPRAGERSSTLAEQRPALDHPRSHPPVRRATVARRRQQPTVEPRGGGRRLGDERCPPAVDDRPAGRPRARRPRRRRGRRPPQRRSRRMRRTPAERRTRGPSRAAASCSTTASAAQPDELPRQAVTFPLGRLQGGARRRQRVRARCERDPASGGTSNTPRRTTARSLDSRQHDEHDERGRQRDQRTAAVGEVEADAEGHRRDRRDRLPGARRAVARSRRRSRGPRRQGGRARSSIRSASRAGSPTTGRRPRRSFRGGASSRARRARRR